MRNLGVIAGVGPMAGVHFYERLVRLTPAANDQEHLPLALVSRPEVTNRVKHLLGDGASPAPGLRAAAQQLERAGAELIVIASVTTHAYHYQVQEAVDIPVLNLLAEVGRALEYSGFHRPAFLGTQATAQLRLFEPYLGDDVCSLYPDLDTQIELQSLIDQVKAGVAVETLWPAAAEILVRPWCDEADVAVLACTEVPLVVPTSPSATEWTTVKGLPILSVTDVLAEMCVRECLDPVLV
jgi:aspartate racemase